MPSYYDSVGEEPTYELAENIIKANIQKIKENSNVYEAFSSTLSYAAYSSEVLGYRYMSSLSSKSNDTAIAIQLIIKHFPDVLKRSNNALYIKDNVSHLLNANDLLVMEYYLFLFNQYEKRVNKYQRYLKKQQDKQHLKLLFVLCLPFILLILMILAGD